MSSPNFTKNPIGLAVIGCGSVGRLRSSLARAYPGVEWLGLCDVDEKKGEELSSELGADFFTTDYSELLGRSEVNAVMVCTTNNDHVGPIRAALEAGNKPKMLIEKPLATSAVDSAKLLQDIEGEGIEAFVGYTQRFRRKYIAVKQQILSGHIGDPTSGVAKVFMNGISPHHNLSRTEHRSLLTPMVVSGTHCLDMSMWLMGDKKPVEIYSRSVDTALGGLGTQDATFGIFTFEDRAMLSMNMSWALPLAWPTSAYSMDIGLVGTKGAILIDDTHRDLVMATDEPHATFRTKERPDLVKEGPKVSFLGSYPPGEEMMGQLWGALREETNSWLAHLYTGLETPHATAAEGHRNLVLTMAMDYSAKIGKPVSLPVDLELLEK